MRGQKGLTFAAVVACAHSDRSVTATTTGDEVEGGPPSAFPGVGGKGGLSGQRGAGRGGEAAVG